MREFSAPSLWGAVYAWSFSATWVTRGYRQSLQADELEEVCPGDDVCGFCQGVRDTYVEPKRITVPLVCQATLDTEASPLVDGFLSFDRGVLGVRLHLEGQPVTRIQSSCFLERLQETVSVANEPNVDVLRGARSLQP